MIYTIGHSTLDLETFLNLLTSHGVTAIADVRSVPYSSYNPHFSRENLKASLEAEGLAYVFLGQELGVRPTEASLYVDGRASYKRIEDTGRFAQGIARVERGAEQFTVALLCSEGDPLTCHRAILVAKHLAERGEDVTHILTDGRLESFAAGERRLLEEEGFDPNQIALPGMEDDNLAAAYASRIAKIAYRRGEAHDE